MVRNYKNVYFTKEDLNGFCLSDLSDEDKKYLKRQYIKEGLKVYLFCGVVIVFDCIVSNILSIEIVTFILSLLSYAMVFVILLQIIATLYGVSKIKKLRCLSVSIIRKLPVEHCTECSAGISRSIDFYPIVGRDINTGYESVCYISKKKYEDGIINETVKIFK